MPALDPEAVGKEMQPIRDRICSLEDSIQAGPLDEQKGLIVQTATLDALGAVLSSHLDQNRAYIGCMKSGEVFSQPSHKWYEPDWWKFGDGKSYFRHASGEIFAISQALAQFISINRVFLRTFSHDDVSAGSWFIGLNVKHVDEAKFCCSSWSSGAVCAAA